MPDLWNISNSSRLTRRRKTVKLCRALSDLVVYTNSVAAQDIVDDGKADGMRATPALFSVLPRFPLFSQGYFQSRVRSEVLFSLNS